MYVAIPLYGTFEVLDPLRPADTRAGRRAGRDRDCAGDAAGRGDLHVGRVPRGRRRGASCSRNCWPVRRSFPAALLGFDPPTGLELALIVLAMGIVGVAVYGYAALAGGDPDDRHRLARVGDARGRGRRSR